MKIELQLRTKLQHAWATAVEIVDSFEGEQLKLGRGGSEWSRLFYLVADEFAKLEKLPLHNNNITNRIDTIRELCNHLNIIDKLKYYTHTLNIAKQDNIEKATFVILNLHIDEKKRSLGMTFCANQAEAEKMYMALEKLYINNSSNNILMVRISSIKQIQKSYPNYFADSKIFIDNLQAILKK